MITITLSDAQIASQRAQGYVIFCDDTMKCGQHIDALAEQFYKPLQATIDQRKFAGAAGSSLVVTGIHEGKPALLILIGLGAKMRPAHDRLEQVRRAMGQVIRIAEQYKINQLAIQTPDHHWCETDSYVLAREMTSTLMMTAYHFDQFITDASRKHCTEYKIIFCAPALEHDRMQVGIEHGQRIGFAVNQARNWCDLPACFLTPTVLADHAQRIAKAHNLTSKIFTEKQVQEMGMGGLTGVSQGSAQECRLVVLEYKTDAPNAPTIGLVGKGVTFDSGGLSIKPAHRMDEMKDDMAGAATVISSMELIAHLKPRVNVIGIAPITENLPSGTALRPGDIVQFYNGKTAEVKNTDAEGRLILADALSYAVKNYKLDALINFATLTGSCSSALGPFFCGLMSKHDHLAEQITHASFQSGDRAWRLPFHDDYKVAIKSTVADLCNIGNESYRAGSITAGFFLQNFVDDVPWAHLDIAGTSFNVPDVSYYRPGSTGFGVRLIANLLLAWQAKDS